MNGSMLLLLLPFYFHGDFVLIYVCAQKLNPLYNDCVIRLAKKN